MTVAEAAEEIARREALGHKHIILVVPGIRNGVRARVIPGVMGKIVGCTHDGKDTVVDVVLADWKRGVERLAMTELAKQAVSELP
jgi:hypothetical protein